MRLIVIDREGAEGTRLCRLLASLGHQVERVTSQDGVERAVCPVRPPDVAIVVLPDSLAVQWLDVLADASKSRHIYLIGCLKALTGDAVSAAWDLGMDDIFSWGASPEEIAGRVEALCRIRGWIGTLQDAMGTEPFGLDRLGTASELGAVLADELTGVVGAVSVRPRESVEPLAECDHFAEVVLSLPGQHLAVRFGLHLPERCTEAFGSVAFGGVVAPNLIDDALCEMANTVGGALKRRALARGYTFALGLPRTISEPPTGASHCWRVRHEGFVLSGWIGMDGAYPRRIPAGTLQEGMVLVQEVRRDDGQLLVASGTVLTRRTISQLGRVIGQSALVQVAPGA